MARHISPAMRRSLDAVKALPKGLPFEAYQQAARDAARGEGGGRRRNPDGGERQSNPGIPIWLWALAGLAAYELLKGSGTVAPAWTAGGIGPNTLPDPSGGWPMPSPAPSPNPTPATTPVRISSYPTGGIYTNPVTGQKYGI